MSNFSPSITDQVVGRPLQAPPAVPDTSASMLAHGVLEELYRRREAIAFSLVLLLCLLAAAVGLRVWSIDGTSATALDRPDAPVSHSSADTVIGGPSGTWQRWGDLGSEKRSQGPAAAPSGTSTTTFSTTGVSPGEPVVSPTTTTTRPASS